MDIKMCAINIKTLKNFKILWIGLIKYRKNQLKSLKNWAIKSIFIKKS